MSISKKEFMANNISRIFSNIPHIRAEYRDMFDRGSTTPVGYGWFFDMISPRGEVIRRMSFVEVYQKPDAYTTTYFDPAAPADNRNAVRHYSESDPVRITNFLIDAAIRFMSDKKVSGGVIRTAVVMDKDDQLLSVMARYDPNPLAFTQTHKGLFYVFKENLPYDVTDFAQVLQGALVMLRSDDVLQYFIEGLEYVKRKEREKLELEEDSTEQEEGDR